MRSGACKKTALWVTTCGGNQGANQVVLFCGLNPVTGCVGSGTSCEGFWCRSVSDAAWGWLPLRSNKAIGDW